MSSDMFGGGAAKAARNQQVAAAGAEIARQQGISDGTNAINTTFSQFNDDFFGARKKGYLDYATPQLEDQFGKAKKELLFSLDRSGVLDSSIRSQREAELQKLYDTNSRSIADAGLSYANDARNNVENARANLLATLNSTGNAQAAASSAINQASSLSQPASYSPLGALFADFTSGLGQQAALEKNAALFGASQGGRYNTGLFGPSRSAVQVT